MVYVVGHRGAPEIAPENTVRSFRAAVELGVDFVEMDVRLTGDGHAVILHDKAVDRTTDGRGALEGMRLAEVRELDAGEGEKVPTLEEALAAAKPSRVLCELKGPGVEEVAARTVRALRMEDQVVFTSFHLDRLERIQRHGGDLKVGAIFEKPGKAEIREALALGAVNVGVSYKKLSWSLVRKIKKTGVDLRAWNPDSLEAQRAMIALGVDGIGTNRPDLLIAYLRESVHRGP